MKRPSLFLSLPWSRRTPPRLAFEQQRRRAANRGIAWLLSFEQWWSIWTTSGKFAERGRGRGYCMARRGDIGPYGVENVYICTIAENSSESLRVKPNALRRPPGRGWSYRPDGTEKILKVAYDHLERLMALANDEMGDPSIELIGPELAKERK